MSHMSRRVLVEVMASSMPWPICLGHGKRYKVFAKISCSIAIDEKELTKTTDPKRKVILEAQIAKKTASLKNPV